MTDLEIAFENFKFNFQNLTEEQHNEVLRHISVSLGEFQKASGMTPTDGSIYRTMVLCAKMLKYIPNE